ncbi:MAG TPA: RNA polymerase sigma factor [Opitutaceae bacterium]|jgi:RNA polymerase sigma factor (sigma-70 family)|nr:RNA polymerase sigma factor [Opitutaceae bacterium]
MRAASETLEARTHTDHELMLAVKSGEIGRLGELFQRHHQALYGFFVRMTGQHASSEDLVQLVFYRILKYRHTYRDEGRFTAWIYHIARKAAFDHFRKQPPINQFDLGSSTAEELPDSTLKPDECAARKDDLAYMQAALLQLPDEQREVLVLHRFQDLQHDEIAVLLGCSVGAVKVRAHRALTALRDVYFRLRRDRSA